MQAHPQSSPAARNLAIFSPPRSSTTEEKAVDESQGGLPPLSEGSGLAHDAGNLLGALSLYCELLEAPGVLAPHHRHYITELRLIYERSGALLSRLLHLTPDQFNTGTTYPSKATGKSAPAHQSPAETLHALAPVLSSMAAPYAQVTLEVPRQLPPIELSAEALERIAVNLVRNAAEAIHHSQLSGGHIHVSLHVVAGRLRLSVEDNGPGMPPALAAAFLHPAPLPPGTHRGYGHRNIHELSESTRGRIGIHVRPGRGTTLCVDWEIHGSLHSHHPQFSHRSQRSLHLAPVPRIAALRLRPGSARFNWIAEGDQPA
jgi:anti-sigma regulatory factor (Ser/Thr protein kinase)